MPALFYHSGNEAFRALERAIRSADREILIGLYFFNYDDIGRFFIGLLEERARAGVRVRLLFDAAGSREGEWDILKRLNAAGVRVRMFRPYRRFVPRHPLAALCRQHARIVLIDRKTLGLGGIGFANIYQAREDLFMLLPVDEPDGITRYFDYLWELADRVTADYPAEPASPLSGITLVASGPRAEEQRIYRWVLEACRSARRRIIVMTPFFFPPRNALRELLNARSRGVDLTVITPLRTDKPRYDRFRALPAPLLTRHGARWFGTRHYFHEKFFIFDDRWLFGSANFDVISMQRNYELDIAGRGGAILRELERVAEGVERTTSSISAFPAPWLFRYLARLSYGFLEFFFALT